MAKTVKPDVPITVNPRDIEHDVPKAVRALNENVQQLLRRVIALEGKVEGHDEVINGA